MQSPVGSAKPIPQGWTALAIISLLVLGILIAAGTVVEGKWHWSLSVATALLLVAASVQLSSDASLRAQECSVALWVAGLLIWSGLGLYRSRYALTYQIGGAPAIVAFGYTYVLLARQRARDRRQLQLFAVTLGLLCGVLLWGNENLNALFRSLAG